MKTILVNLFFKIFFYLNLKPIREMSEKVRKKTAEELKQLCTVGAWVRFLNGLIQKNPSAADAVFTCNGVVLNVDRVEKILCRRNGPNGSFTTPTPRVYNNEKFNIVLIDETDDHTVLKQEGRKDVSEVLALLNQRDAEDYLTAEHLCERLSGCGRSLGTVLRVLNEQEIHYRKDFMVFRDDEEEDRVRVLTRQVLKSRTETWPDRTEQLFELVKGTAHVWLAQVSWQSFVEKMFSESEKKIEQLLKEAEKTDPSVEKVE